MLDPRIYRTGLIVAALALVVLGFSVRNQQPALSSNLAPEAFNAQNVVSSMQRLQAAYPNRPPGSPADGKVADTVAASLAQNGFSVRRDYFSGRTINGTQRLENVVGVQPGIQSGSIVIVADRDGSGAAGIASLSATATLMELARDLAGETLHRTVVLASSTGTQGTAGAVRLASTLPGPIDAVIVLGDLASTRPRPPILVPWSTRRVVAPPALRNTVAAALAAQTALTAGSNGLGGQFAHLAFPLTLGTQAPFGAAGIPAVELSLAGDQGPAVNAPAVDAGLLIAGLGSQLNGLGRATLQSIFSLDGGPTLPAPSSYLLLDGKVVPGWAISLFGLALLVPVVMTTIDAVARARRRGHVIWRSLVIVLAAAVPFVAALLVILVARLVGLIGVAPPGPVAPGAVPMHGGGLAVLVVAALVGLAAAAGVVLMVRRLPPKQRTRGRTPARAADGPAVAVLVVLCAVAVAIWLDNPFAALLLIPALHAWMWASAPGLPGPRALRLLLILVGLVPGALLVLYYANSVGYGPLGLTWQAALLLAGHAVSLLSAVEWSVALGCLLSAATLAALSARGSRAASAPVTVRGPISYAGPGSLGGTESALRR